MKDWMEVEKHKIKREIQLHGDTYTFVRETKDDYGEPTGETTEVATICGLFHMSKGYVTRNISDGTKTHGTGQPMILLLWEDAINIQSGDAVEINGIRHRVVAKNNVQEYNLFCDISLDAEVLA